MTKIRSDPRNRSLQVDQPFSRTFNIRHRQLVASLEKVDREAFEDRDFRSLTSRVRLLSVIVLSAGLDLSGRIETEQ